MRRKRTYRKRLARNATLQKRAIHKTQRNRVNHVKTRKIHKMNCHPHTKNLAVKNSCYTPNILEQIKEAYNKGHQNDPIKTTHPEEIWNELKKRLTDCPAEDCWLKELKDDKLRKRIDRYIFAPDKPYEWKKNPNEWLSNFDILNVLEQYEETYHNFDFIGPTPIDFDTHKKESNTCVWNELCTFSLKQKLKQRKNKIGIVFNTDPHTKSGAHWIAMFIDIPAQLIYFFDSAGAKPPKEVDILAERIIEQGKENRIHFKYVQNAPNQHQHGTTECGMYCLFFIITMLTGKIEDKREPLSKRLHLFTKGKISDKFAEKYRDIYFNNSYGG
jgi:hypothetical protein